MKPLSRALRIAALCVAFTWSFDAAALEYPIGTPHNVAGMEIAALYLQAIDMEPQGMMRKAIESDIHLEADIHALANNANGYPEGFWIPFLLVRYEITKLGSSEVIKGDMLMKTGDLIIARQFYSRAFQMGAVEGAMGVAKTYDPTVFAEMKVQGITPDAAKAAEWYEKAKQAGVTEAEAALTTVSAAAQP